MPDLTAGVVDVDFVGRMLVIGFDPTAANRDPRPTEVQRAAEAVSKGLGIRQEFLQPLSADHPSHRSHRSPVLGLKLSEFDHLSDSEAVARANQVLQQSGGKYDTLPSPAPHDHGEVRPTNRTSLRRSQKGPRKH